MVTHITGMNSSKNSKSDLLLAVSKWKANAARVIELGKGKSVGDWPSMKTKISFPTVGAFSESNLMAVGSTNGFINTFKIE